MSIRYLNYSDAVDWLEVSNIFTEVGWGARAAEQIKSAFQRSSFVRFAYVDDRLGWCRTNVDAPRYTQVRTAVGPAIADRDTHAT